MPFFSTTVPFNWGHPCSREATPGLSWRRDVPKSHVTIMTIDSDIDGDIDSSIDGDDDEVCYDG
jgi:hypothetical protein